MASVPRITVDLHGPPQTMLATLYAKALDAQRQQPILRDVWAMDAVAHIDYDWTKTTITDRMSPAVTTRALHFDTWARQFLARHERAVVLHLGAGLDSRVYRLDPGPGVEWYDVDYPSIMQLREQIYPQRAHYHRIAASVTDPGWLDQIAADRPVLALAEGLTMYLTESDGIALLRRIVDRSPSGELQFDAFNRFGVRNQWLNSVVRRSGSTLHWGIDGPDDILAAVPGARLLAWLSPFEADSFRDVPRNYRVMARVMALVPALKTMAQYHRYAF
ncbi:class I SAM-dependent methyltransferase [Mycobacterium sp. CVI_P3]|uniref:Class I SAM-dependent methyltransferase n=1 Tax=Mycobacterium pinniadriaticum TaxID=2994102 RepID=A0ABT3S8K3_9MYCO|nr:class I SAM-dependent methyltransferase [Mycobacterium pinniadriaticum]MCX2929074.1 class I SAM-dependent methyltransferase [Mycobacterium pinniadriaticum]MCX2935499.1 class I SAM-dependent methyltransferase [Mycobacterium pinniadriaticum]